jgi:Flp pilus assembly protein TadG
MVAIMAPAFLLLVGLVFDGGMALDAKQRGYDVAEQAARYGAAHGISEQALRNNQLTIDPGLAETAATQFVNDTNDSRVSFDSARVDLNGVGDQIVTVTVRVKAHSAFLCGCDLSLGTVQAHARVLRGVNAPGG